MRSYVAAAETGGGTVRTLAPLHANDFDVMTHATPNGQTVEKFVANNLMPRHP